MLLNQLSKCTDGAQIDVLLHFHIYKHFPFIRGYFTSVVALLSEQEFSCQYNAHVVLFRFRSQRYSCRRQVCTKERNTNKTVCWNQLTPVGIRIAYTKITSLMLLSECCRTWCPLLNHSLRELQICFECRIPDITNQHNVCCWMEVIFDMFSSIDSRWIK